MNSIKKNKTGILLMVVSSLCVCTGQLFWKLSATHGMVSLILGFVLYAIGALVMIVAYKFGSLSVLQPMLSLNYVLTVILAKTVLDETITALKAIGIAVIIIGIILIGSADDSV